MTDTAAAPPATDTRSRLAAAAAKRAGKTVRRTSTAKRPTTSRAAAAAKRGKHADRIAPAIKAGAAFWAIKSPVRAAILVRQADPFAAALDKVAAEDPRVDALLVKIGGLFGKSGAWGELGTITFSTAGALMLAGGTAPAGPLGMVLAMLAGPIVQAAATDAAYGMIADQLAAQSIDATPDPAHVAQLAAELLAPKSPPAPDEQPAAGDDTDTDGYVAAGYGLGYEAPTAGDRGHVPVWGA